MSTKFRNNDMNELTGVAVFALEARGTDALSHRLITLTSIEADWTVLPARFPPTHKVTN